MNDQNANPPLAGQLVTEMLEFDDGRNVTAYVPPDPPDAVVVTGDGQLTSDWAQALELAGMHSAMIVGVHRPADETSRLHEYSGAELALALGHRHPDVYGAVLCASPGAGYWPPDVMPAPVPRTYLVAGTLEPFFLANATRWASAIQAMGVELVMSSRVGGHGDGFWRDEFPRMVAWAFGR